MICPGCGTNNEDDYIFCVNCGISFSSTALPTQQIPAQQIRQTVKFRNDREISSEATAFPRHERHSAPPKSSKKWIFAVLGLFVVLAGGIAAASLAYFYRPATVTQLLPGHLGLFAVANDNASLVEITKRDVPNMNDLLKLADGSEINVISGKPEFLLYADPNDIKVSELKLIDLSSVTDKGIVKQINYQVTLVEGRSEMKRLLFNQGLPNGKYAFALIDGYFDEGKHRIWAFELRGSNAEATDQDGTELTLTLKTAGSPDPDTAGSNTNSSNTAVPAPKPAPTVDIPVGSRVAFCNASSVILRDKASLNGKRITLLKKGQRVFVISYSDNYDDWKGIRANWAYIQTENGRRGWVFTPFITY